MQTDGTASAGTTPPWTREDYERNVSGLVAEETPALFALVEDRDDLADARIAAWVLEFSSRAEAVTTDTSVRISAPSAPRVLARFGTQPGVTARLIPAGRPA